MDRAFNLCGAAGPPRGASGATPRTLANLLPPPRGAASPLPPPLLPLTTMRSGTATDTPSRCRLDAPADLPCEPSELLLPTVLAGDTSAPPLPLPLPPPWPPPWPPLWPPLGGTFSPPLARTDAALAGRPPLPPDASARRALPGLLSGRGCFGSCTPVPPDASARRALPGLLSGRGFFGSCTGLVGVSIGEVATTPPIDGVFL